MAATATPFVLVYRISSGGYPKDKPAYITKDRCFLNFLSAIVPLARALREGVRPGVLRVVADNVSEPLFRFIGAALRAFHAIPGMRIVSSVDRTSFGNGAASYQHALRWLRTQADAMQLSELTWVYFVEDDYVHRPEALLHMHGILGDLRIHYATLYDHPDKYVDAGTASGGGTLGNPLVQEGGELSRVMATSTTHVKTTNSTTMTFGARYGLLVADFDTHMLHTAPPHPHDFWLWLELTAMGRKLVSAVPGQATHGETAYLSPFTDWAAVMDASLLTFDAAGLRTSSGLDAPSTT